MHKLRIENGGVSGGRSRGRYATPADFPRHDCSPYSHVHVRCDSLGVVHRSSAFSVAPCQTLAIRNLCIAVGWESLHLVVGPCTHTHPTSVEGGSSRESLLKMQKGFQYGP